MRTIYQYIAEALEGTKIFEMAKSLSDYKNMVEDLIKPISSHILLVLKARQENSEEFVIHWKKEIKGFIRSFFDIKLKTKNTYNKRLEHIENVLLKQEEIDINDEWFKAKLWKKLDEEGYDLDDPNIYKDFEPIIHDFQDNHLPKIIDIIASQDIIKLNNYINSL